MTVPHQGVPAQTVLADLEGLRTQDPPLHGGRVLAYLYDAGVPGLSELGRQALAGFGEVNGLDPTVFPSVGALENDLVGWASGLLGAGPDARGTATSGGTESCVLAVLAAREQWRRLGRSGTPTVVLGTSAHPAFAKAAHLLGLALEPIDVDPTTMRLRPEDVGAALERLGGSAALAVVSAPSYPHGVIDPVAPIAALAADRGVACHVDACIGGVVLPYLARAGRDVPPFDLAVPGVRSLSVDLHKYGYAPKGVSLLLFSDADYRHGSYFAYSAWPGYPVVNTTLQSTRSAGPLAAAWAVLRALGEDGMRDAALRCVEATDRIVAAVDRIAGLRVVGRPDSTLVAVAGDPDRTGTDPFILADRLRLRGWIIQPQPSFGVLPRTAHLTVQPASLAHIEEFVADLEAAAREAAGQPWCVADPGLVDLANQLDPATLTAADVRGLLAVAGLATGGTPALPTPAAPVHALIEALPVALRDRLLAGFLGELFRADFA